jgi:hypothetical protein
MPCLCKVTAPLYLLLDTYPLFHGSLAIFHTSPAYPQALTTIGTVPKNFSPGL